MTLKAEILSRFSDSAIETPLYLPDLTLWYDWHHKKGTLPDKWRGYSLPQIARAIGVPIWLTLRPWRIETPSVTVTTTQENQERTVRTETSAGTLIARWIVGPDGAWWQTEYPVKSEKDFDAVLELANARTYVFNDAGLAQLEAEVGDDGVLAIEEIPRRPFSDLLHEILGWSEGLMFLGEPAVPEINTILENKLQDFIREIADLPGQIVFSPDNLDGQFFSPPLFQEYMVDSYRLTAQILHQHNKLLVVHVGGPIKHLVAPLAETGIDGLEGVAGSPQSDISPADIRKAVGLKFTLWGGIPQDFLLATRDEEDFEATVIQAVQETVGDNRIILGVADRVPVDAELDRLEAIPKLINQALTG